MEAKVPDMVTEAGEHIQTKDDGIASKLQICLLMASLFCGTFVMALDSTIIGTAVPSITTHFGTLDDIAWYGSSYLLTITAFQPLLGKLYQVVDIKLVFMTCIVIFEGKSSLATIYRAFIRADFRSIQSAQSFALRLQHRRSSSSAGHLLEQVPLACFKGLLLSLPRLSDWKTAHCVSASSPVLLQSVFVLVLLLEGHLRNTLPGVGASGCKYCSLPQRSSPTGLPQSR